METSVGKQCNFKIDETQPQSGSAASVYVTKYSQILPEAMVSYCTRDTQHKPTLSATSSSANKYHVTKKRRAPIIPLRFFGLGISKFLYPCVRITT